MSDKTPPSAISTLTAAHGHVLLLFPSGTPETPLTASVGYRDASGEMHLVSERASGAGADRAIGFVPLPWSEADAEALITGCETQEGKHMGATLLTGADLSIATFDIVNDAEFIGAERAVNQIAEILGLYEQGYRMPQDAGPIVTQIRELAVEVLGRQLSAEDAIELARRLIDGSALAEESEVAAV